MRVTAAFVGILMSIALLTAAGVVPAQETPEDESATRGELDFANVTYVIRTYEEGDLGTKDRFEPGADGVLRITFTSESFEPAPADGNRTTDGNQTGDQEPAGNETAEDQPEGEGEPRTLELDVEVTPPDGIRFTSGMTRTVTLTLDGESEEEVGVLPFTVDEGAVPATDVMQITFTDAETGDSDFTTHRVTVVQPPAPPSPVSPVVIAGAVLGVLVVGGGAYALARRRRPAPARRSSTLQRMEMERKAERAKTDDERQRIQQDMKQQEAQKAQAREVQILVAKRKDVERMIGLIKKRHEAGQLSKLQYEKMVEKKQGELDDLNRQISELENRNGSA